MYPAAITLSTPSTQGATWLLDGAGPNIVLALLARKGRVYLTLIIGRAAATKPR
jgi:hypothetical protein